MARETLPFVHVVYSGAHGGFDTTRIPLGGGAAVMDALVREWSRTSPFDLTVLGVGDRYDLPHIRYVRLPVSIPKPLTELGELEYARFCRAFERAATEWIRVACRRQPPTLVLCNDISEGPNFRELAALGIPIVTIFHVDVVEYVAKFYCHSWIKPDHLTRLHRGLRNLHLAGILPDVVRLIFDKQADSVRYSTKFILPSVGMAKVLRSCYPGCDPKIEVLPWGAIEEDVRSQETGVDGEDLRKEFGVTKDEVVLLTLCRISPEKGIDRLVEVLIQWEQNLRAASVPRLRLFVCGAPAYMQGRVYMEKLRRLVSRLKTVRVDFVGHVTGERKQAFFDLADLYVHLSYHESYGLTIAEAMRAGCPVLTTNHHSARDLVPVQCGRVVSGQVEETVTVLQELLADKTRLKAMGHAAAGYGKKLSFADAAASLADVLKQACTAARF